MDAEDAPSPMYVVRFPSSKRKVTNRDGDAELAAILSKTEIMVADFHQKARLSQRFGQALLDLLRHPQFNLADIKSENIVHLIRRLERPFQETRTETYNLWKEGDGNQRLELVVRDYLEVFREIMRSPEWKDHFDLVFTPRFDASGERLIGPASSALRWQDIQSKLPDGTALGFTQLSFDETFMGQTQGIDTGSLTSMNLKNDARFQTSSVKLFALIPTYDVDAADKSFSSEQIKKRQMEIHQASIAVFVRDMNKYSSRGGEVDILCPDGRVYNMLIILMCLSMDHEATERHCLKAANGCLSCDCSWEELDDCSDQFREPMLVEGVIIEIEKAAAEFLNDDGTIKDGCIKKVEDWEKLHKIKLQWNNWFDVSDLLLGSLLFYALFLALTSFMLCSTAFSASASNYISVSFGVSCIVPLSGSLGII